MGKETNKFVVKVFFHFGGDRVMRLMVGDKYRDWFGISSLETLLVKPDDSLVYFYCIMKTMSLVYIIIIMYCSLWYILELINQIAFAQRIDYENCLWLNLLFQREKVGTLILLSIDIDENNVQTTLHGSNCFGANQWLILNLERRLQEIVTFPFNRGTEVEKSKNCILQT